MIADASGGQGGAGMVPDATAGAGGAGGIDQPDVGVGGADSGRAGGMLDALLDPVRDADAQTTSGTRIKAKWLVTADGARQPNGWYDSMRKEDCLFTAAGDGKTRCIPLFGAGATIYFTDAACSQPLAALSLPTDAGCQASAIPKYGWFPDYSCSAAGSVGLYRTFSVGSAVATPSTAFQKSVTNCTAISSTALYRWYTATEVAPTEFAEGVVQIDP